MNKIYKSGADGLTLWTLGGLKGLIIICTAQGTSSDFNIGLKEYQLYIVDAALTELTNDSSNSEEMSSWGEQHQRQAIIESE